MNGQFLVNELKNTVHRSYIDRAAEKLRQSRVAPTGDSTARSQKGLVGFLLVSADYIETMILSVLLDFKPVLLAF